MSKMLGNIVFAVLVVAFGAGTLLVGWWTVPIIALVWGGLAPSRMRAGVSAAVAAVLSWALLLGWMATQGSVVSVAGRVGAIYGVPGIAFFAITLAFVALLAGSAALVAGALTPARRSKTTS